MTEWSARCAVNDAMFVLMRKPMVERGIGVAAGFAAGRRAGAAVSPVPLHMRAANFFRPEVAFWRLLGMLRAMKKNLAAFLSVLSLSLVVACGGGNAAVGTYTLDTDAVKASVQEMFKDMPGGGKEMVDGMTKDMQGTIELKADGTASMDQKGGPSAGTTQGTWKLEGDKVSMTAKDKAGKETTLTGTLAGKVLTLDLPEMAPGKKLAMKFNKK